MRRILILIFIIILVGGGTYWYLKNKNTTTPNTAQTGSFFPTGQTTTNTPTGALPNSTEIKTEQKVPTTANSRFTQVSARAVAGFTQYTDIYKVPVPATDPKKKPTFLDITDYVVRYISRGTGYVYEKRNNEQLLQISNIYIPNVYEASFADGNNTALLRFLREDNHTIATYNVPVPPKNPDGTRTQKEGSFLPDNISNLLVSPDQTEIGRLTIATTQEILVTSNTLNKNQKEIFRSPFQEWLGQWPNKNTFYLQTKAAASADGFLYKLDRTEKKLRRVVGNVPGLTTSVSPSGALVLYSESNGSSFITKILNTKTNSTTTLNLKILPEKCTWLVNEDLICAGDNIVAQTTYPDSWYAGTSHFSDKLFRIYTKTNTFDILYDNTQSSYDMTNLSVEETQNILYFIDKNTGLLWQYKI